MEWLAALAALRCRRAGTIRRRAAILAEAGAIGTALTVLTVGCGSNEPAATRLVDGTAAPALPSSLDDLGDAVVATRTRTLRVSRLGNAGRACLRQFRPEFTIPPGTIVVDRAGLVGTSLTFRDRRGDFVLGCDRTDEPGGATPPWCARSAGGLVLGRLTDPRLDILCRGRPPRDGAIGFAWVDPMPTSRWLAVHDNGRTELYEVLAGLPVRVTTTDVDVGTSSAVVDLTEYDESGKVVRSRRLRASVAG